MNVKSNLKLSPSFLFLCCFISLFFSSTHFYSSLNDFEQFPHLRTMSSISTQVLDTILCHFFYLVKVKSKWQRNPVLKRTASYPFFIQFFFYIPYLLQLIFCCICVFAWICLCIVDKWNKLQKSIWRTLSWFMEMA